MNSVTVVGEMYNDFSSTTTDDGVVHASFGLVIECKGAPNGSNTALVNVDVSGHSAKYLEQYSRERDLLCVSGELAIIVGEWGIIARSVDKLDTRSNEERKAAWSKKQGGRR